MIFVDQCVKMYKYIIEVEGVAAYFMKTNTSYTNEEPSFKRTTHRGKVWTDEENNYLKNNFSKMRTIDLAEHLGVSYSIVQRQLAKLELTTKTRILSESELEFIKSQWGILPASQIAKQLNTTKATIYGRAKKLGLPMVKNNRLWTLEEENYLKINYGRLSVEELAESLNRTKASIHAKAAKLNLTTSFISLCEVDIAFLKANWEKLSAKELAKHFNLSVESIYRYAKLLNLSANRAERHWTVEEEAYLIKYWNKKKRYELEKIFNCRGECLRRKAKMLGIYQESSRNRRWTDEETHFLQSNWEKLDVFELAKELDRRPESIRTKARELKLKRLRPEKDLVSWTAEEEAFLVENWDTRSQKYLMRHLNKSYAAIASKANRLNLGPKLDNGYTALEVSRMLGFHKSKVIDLINEGKLKAKYSKNSSRRKYNITEKQLKSFMKAHPDLWSFETINFDPFHDTNGKWITEKRKNDHEKHLAGLAHVLDQK